MKRFIIAVDGTTITAGGRNELTAFLEGKGWSIWHWFPDLWLVDEVYDSTSAAALRDQIKSLVRGVNVMVMTPEGSIDYAGFIKTTSMEWLHQHWKTR